MTNRMRAEQWLEVDGGRQYEGRTAALTRELDEAEARGVARGEAAYQDLHAAHERLKDDNDKLRKEIATWRSNSRSG